MKSYRTHLAWICLVLMVALVGCDSGATTSGSSDMDALAAQLDQAKQAEANAKVAAEAAAAKSAADKQAAEEAAQREAERQASEQAAAAQAGRTTGAAGQEGGYMSAIVAAHRHITTRVDDLAWTQALQHHKATTGEMPKNHEEFMRVMAEGGIPLPELEQGQELFWDSSEGTWGTLYIVEPNPQAQPPAPAQ